MALYATASDTFGPFAFGPEVLEPCVIAKPGERGQSTQSGSYIHQPADAAAAMTYAYSTTSTRQLCFGGQGKSTGDYEDLKGASAGNWSDVSNRQAWISGCRITPDHLSKMHFQDYRAIGIPVGAKLPDTAPDRKPKWS